MIGRPFLEGSRAAPERALSGVAYRRELGAEAITSWLSFRPPDANSSIPLRLGSRRRLAGRGKIAVMRNLTLSFVLCLPLAAGEFTGWISDSSCGKGNASGEASSRECAERCIKDGAKPVLVTDGEQQVLELVGGEIKGHLRHKVKVTGALEGGKIKVSKIEKAD